MKNAAVLQVLLEHQGEVDAVLRPRHSGAGPADASGPSAPKMIPRELRFLYGFAGAGNGEDSSTAAVTTSSSSSSSSTAVMAAHIHARGNDDEEDMYGVMGSHTDDDIESDADLDSTNGKRRKKKRKKEHDAKPWVPPDIGAFALKNGHVVEDKRDQPIVPLIDSTSLYVAKDHAGMWFRFQQDGYIYLKNVIPRDVILKTRTDLFASLKALRLVDDGNKSLIYGNKEKITASTGYNLPIDFDQEIRRWKNKGKSTAWLEEQWKNLCSSESLDEVQNYSSVVDVLHLLSKGMSKASKLAVYPKLFGKDLS